MTLLTNSLEGGTNGTTISSVNSGGASGNAFDGTLVSGTGAALTYDNTHAAHGTLAAKVASGSSAGTSYALWSGSIGTQSQVWFRMYLYYTANPANTHRVFTGVNGASNCASLQVTSAGKLQWINSANTAIINSTATIPLNQWFRVEGFLIGSATVGQVETKLFNSPDASSPDETDTSTANQNTFGSITGNRFGVSGSTANVTFWMDDLGLSSIAYIGPSVVATDVPYVIAQNSGYF